MAFAPACTIPAAELLVMGYNVLMHREMKDVFEPFEDGDHIPSDISLLESYENYKIRCLVRTLRAMDAASDSFININLLDPEILERNFQEGSDLRKTVRTLQGPSKAQTIYPMRPG